LDSWPETCKDSITIIDREVAREVEDRWWGRIVGPGQAQKIIFLERATISTTVSTKGYVAAGGELQGEKQVGLNHSFPRLHNRIVPKGYNPGTY
jgi:hypothetical protein